MDLKNNMKTLYLWDLSGTLFYEQWDPELTGFADFDDYAKSIGILPTDYKRYEKSWCHFYENGNLVHLDLMKGFKELLSWTKYNETFSRGTHEQIYCRAKYLNPKVGFDILKFFQKIVSILDYEDHNIKTEEIFLKYLSERFDQGYGTIVYTDDALKNCKNFETNMKNLGGNFIKSKTFKKWFEVFNKWNMD